MEESRLIGRLQKGDVRALEAVIDRYTPYVNTVVWHILGSSMSREDVEEVVSDVFVVIWERAESIRPGKLKAFLSAAARNLALKKLRSAGQEAPLEEDLLEAELPGPDSDAQRRELARRVQHAVQELGPPDTEIFLRHYYYCQGVETIAREMGMGVSAVKMRLKRGREKLQKRLIREV